MRRLCATSAAKDIRVPCCARCFSYLPNQTIGKVIHWRLVRCRPGVNRLDVGQPSIVTQPARLRRAGSCALLALVVAAGAGIQQLAEDRDRSVLSVSLDERIRHTDPCAPPAR